jgi:hypothetical protein
MGTYVRTGRTLIWWPVCFLLVMLGLVLVGVEEFGGDTNTIILSLAWGWWA